ncbi:hypothetical protein [Streptomyces sp. P3]|uniref:hypothetical protein n=1 Tax=Streptomyces sp. P3 TaxID=2135430 RepID=UPI001573FDFB|nr:hypothetical protein [Streptomyces sp. P3]
MNSPEVVPETCTVCSARAVVIWSARAWPLRICGAAASNGLATGVDRVGEEYVVSVPGRESVRADLVVGALDAVPVIGRLSGSGVAVSDGIVCDFALRTTVPDVVAAGGVARWYTRSSRRTCGSNSGPT